MTQVSTQTGGTTPVPRSTRLNSLTGLRFVAAFAVLLNHVGVELLPRVAPDQKVLLYLFFGFGAIAVSFFFILSGFVLTTAARDTESAPTFWRRRFVKIFPNHLVTMVVAIGLALWAGQQLGARDTLATLFLVQSWIPDQPLLYNIWLNSPTWSLACEVLFYLSFPLLLRLVRRIRPQRLWLAFGATYAAMWVAAVLAGTLPHGSAAQAGTELPWLPLWALTYFPPVRMLEFTLGIIVAQIVLHRRWIRLPFPVAVALPVVAELAQGFVPLRFGFVVVTAVPLALLVGAAAHADLTGRGSIFGGRVMVYLGELSFALFMVHWLVVAYGWIGQTSTRWGADPSAASTWWPTVLAQALTTIVVSLALAWLLYTRVERPLMRRFGRPAASPRRRPVPEESPAPA